MIKISVIIPVYNTEDYLVECLESVLRQTIKEIEIICVNDGSTDNTYHILRDYEARFDNVSVIDQLNAGQSVARNKAIAKAQGKYIYFMDSDDLITSGMLQELWDHCEEKELDVIYFSGTSFYETKDLEDKHKGFKNSYYREGSYPDVLAGPQMYLQMKNNADYSMSPCLQLIKKELLIENAIRFPEGIIHEDNYFSFMVIMKARRTFCVNDIYFYRRVRAASVMTNKESWKNLRGYFVCLMKELEFAGTLEIDDLQVIKKIEESLWLLNNHIQRIYISLTKSEREYFIKMCTPVERYFFKSMILKHIEAKIMLGGRIRTLEEENKALKQIKMSVSFKLGRILTAPLRMIRGGIRCCKEHGFVYSCKYAVKKIIK